MKLNEQELQFCILSSIFRREPFWVLAAWVTWENPAEVDSFVNVLTKVVTAGHLDLHDGERHGFEPGVSFHDNLRKYIQRRVEAGEKLDEFPPDGNDVEFALTAEGSKWLDDAYSESEKAGEKIIDALEQYHSKNGVYPKRLYELCPEFLSVLDDPPAVCGSWWYRATLDLKFYEIAYLTLTGHSFCYDASKGEWV